MQQHRVSVVDLFFHDVLILQSRQSTFPRHWFWVYVLLLPGSKAMTLGYHAFYSETSWDFFLGFFFKSDRLTQYPEAHSTLNEKKNNRGMTLETTHCISVINAFLVLPDVMWKTLSLFQCFPPSRVKETTHRLNIWVKQGITSFLVSCEEIMSKTLTERN